MESLDIIISIIIIIIMCR